CEVKKAKKSAPGKHGHAKMKIRAEGVFDGQSYNETVPAEHKMLAPTIEKKTGQIVSQDGEFAQVMDMDTYETQEMELPDDLDVGEGDEIKFWEIDDRNLIKGEA
ncbi:MAG: translation initiation factor IF-5A, partial [Candidatus Nanohaloarchaea archaeon]